MGPRAGVDKVVKRKIPSLCRDLNHRSSSLAMLSHHDIKGGSADDRVFFEVDTTS